LLAAIGVLALQGDFREHAAALRAIGRDSVLVRKSSDLRGLAGLIIPGGESTVISKLSIDSGLFEEIQRLIAEGFPVFGTCAGLIMLADNLLDATAQQKSFGGLDVTVRRNAFGNQLDSFEADLAFAGIDGLVHVAFIRAPIIEATGAGVEVLARLESGGIVAVRQGNLLGLAFHPEITDEIRVHELFSRICDSANLN
jgi:5'-phosphate synthase pdxT subunit